MTFDDDFFDSTLLIVAGGSTLADTPYGIQSAATSSHSFARTLVYPEDVLETFLLTALSSLTVNI